MTQDMRNTATGILATGTGLGISLSGVNEILTCASLVVGLAVGLASLWKIVRSKTTNHKKK